VIEKARASVSWEASGNQGNLDALARVGDLTGCLTKDIEIKVDVVGAPADGIEGVDAVRAGMMIARQTLPRLQVKIHDLEVALLDPERARATLTASASTDGTRDFSAQEFEFTMRKVDGRWYIRRVETVRTLRQQ
jgi:hypothetical protein